MMVTFALESFSTGAWSGRKSVVVDEKHRDGVTPEAERALQWLSPGRGRSPQDICRPRQLQRPRRQA